MASMCLCNPCESVKEKDQYDKHGMKLDQNMQGVHTKCSESLDEIKKQFIPTFTRWEFSGIYQIGKNMICVLHGETISVKMIM